MNTEKCNCHNPPISYTDYNRRFIGTDLTNGRYGEVAIDKCNQCGSLWLVYFVEYESISNSGRWYRGLMLEKDVATITPENSVDYITSLEWYIFGGSFFNSTGKIGKGNVFVDQQ